MGLFDLFSGFKLRERKGDLGTTGQSIVTRYHQRRARGEFRVDDNLYLELTQVMPEKAAQRIFGEFRTRRAHGHPKAESILLGDIITALLDAEHFASTAKPIHRAEDGPVNYTGLTVLERARAKVLAGKVLTGEEEDAIVFDGLI